MAAVHLTFEEAAAVELAAHRFVLSKQCVQLTGRAQPSVITLITGSFSSTAKALHTAGFILIYIGSAAALPKMMTARRPVSSIPLLFFYIFFFFKRLHPLSLFLLFPFFAFYSFRARTTEKYFSS